MCGQLRPHTRLSRSRFAAVLIGASLVAGSITAAAPADAARHTSVLRVARIQSFLTNQLASLGTSRTTVMVHGADVTTARNAVAATGMRLVTTFDRIGVAVASGTRAQILAVALRPGVTYLEGNTPIEFTLDTSNVATRGAEAVATLTG